MGRTTTEHIPVSIHAPTRGATLLYNRCFLSFYCFNPRTHTGCDVCNWCCKSSICRVSIHAPTRGATLLKDGGIDVHYVSIHAPTRGATRPAYQFNFPFIVSIHAPTRGATREALNRTRANFHVSIHAPTRGATHSKSRFSFSESCFNPRTHTGCDTKDFRKNTCEYSFNPRTHTGCDFRVLPVSPSVQSFQSTHPHGVRRDLTKFVGVSRQIGFNPRTHTGCDPV